MKSYTARRRGAPAATRTAPRKSHERSQVRTVWFHLYQVSKPAKFTSAVASRDMSYSWGDGNQTGTREILGPSVP